MNLSIDLENTPMLMTKNKEEVRVCHEACGDTKFHMYVNLDKKIWHCHKCSSGGRLAIQHKSVLDEKFDQLLKTTMDNYWSSHKDSWKQYTPREVKHTLPLSEDMIIHPDNWGYEYLQRRGITLDQIQKYNIIYSVEKSGPYKNTVIFPIYDKMGCSAEINWKLQYFVARRWDKTEPKYINAPWPKNDTLFFTRHSPGTIIMQGEENIYIIVEGILDALAIERAGYRAIALLGKTATSQQLK